MRAYLIKQTDAGLHAQQHERPCPSPGPHQILVEIKAASLNRGELIISHNAYGLSDQGKPFGNEGAGIVVEVGAEVTGIAVGDRVMGRCIQAFAQFALMEQTEAIPVPPSMSWEQAGSIPLVFMVAYDMLVCHRPLKPGDWVLIAGVTSGVGVACLALSKALGASVIGTSGSAKKLETLKQHGLDVGIATRSPGFAAQVMAATKDRGTAIAINAVGGSVFDDCLQSLGYEGALATVGYLDGCLRSTIDLARLHAMRLQVFGVSNKHRTPAQRADMVRTFCNTIGPMFASGKLAPIVDRVYDFDALPSALDYMMSNQQCGKIVVEFRRLTCD